MIAEAEENGHMFCPVCGAKHDIDSCTIKEGKVVYLHCERKSCSTVYEIKEALE